MFPTLYATNKNGTTKFWRIHVILEESSGIPVVITEYGQKGGKTIESKRSVEKRNKGHDSLYAMAVAMAESKWNHKKEREGYSVEPDGSSKTVFPMLAKTFDNGKYLHFPLYVQPKIDGLRCIVSWDNETKKVKMVSRTNVSFGSSCLEPIRKSLVGFFKSKPDAILDGELFADNVPFEELSGAIRNSESGLKVYYLVFDVIDSGKGFEERFVQNLELPNSPFVRKLETFLKSSLDEAMCAHKTFKDQGYEGTIFRNIKSIYRIGFRSWDLQKLKDFKEEEFEIVGFQEGEGGREKGTVIWECATQGGKRFRVRPRGSLEHRKELWKRAPEFTGSLLTVIFQERTKDGVPRFPVGKDLRKNY